MSIVTIHGPYTFGSKALVGGAAAGAIATVNPANGLIWTLIPNDKSQVAANYDWAYTGAAGTPASPILNTMQPVVTFPAGAHTVTLTLNGVAQAPFTINAVAGVAPLMQELGAGEEVGENVTAEEFAQGQHPDGSVVEPLPGQEYPVEGDGEFDPGAHTIDEVLAYVGDDPELAREVMEAEEAGKGRVTLLTQLESLSFDPGDHTVTEVIGYVEDNPDKLDDVIAAEESGKGRVTLLTHLESMREA
jgi:hypothetical protein